MKKPINTNTKLDQIQIFFLNLGKRLPDGLSHLRDKVSAAYLWVGHREFLLCHPKRFQSRVKNLFMKRGENKAHLRFNS